MNFEWDENKRQKNVRKHGLDFLEALKMFECPMLVRQNTRFDYEEERYTGMGMADSRVLVVVFAEFDHGQTDS